MKKIILLLMVLTFVGCTSMENNYKENVIFTEPKDGTVSLMIHKENSAVESVRLEGVKLRFGKEYYVVPQEDIYITWDYYNFTGALDANEEDGDGGSTNVLHKGWKKVSIKEDTVFKIKGGSIN